jgi:ubiquinone/menaquinone biosynthesis C-methylase UbiE
MTQSNEYQEDRQQKELVRERFTKTAEVFGRYSVAQRGPDVEALARALKTMSSDRAVDLACGAGTLAMRFARRVGWICGLDLTPAMLDRARRWAAADRLTNLDFAVGDAHALPFADATLDIAATSYSLHHMPDPSRVIREMARIVKRGGRVGVIDIRVSENSKTAELANRIERIRDDSHTRSLPLSEFEKMFAESGLRITSTESMEHPRDFDHWMYVAGWTPEDPEYTEAYRLIKETILDDSAGFHPQFVPADAVGHVNGEEQILRIVNTNILIAAEKL